MFLVFAVFFVVWRKEPTKCWNERDVFAHFLFLVVWSNLKSFILAAKCLLTNCNMLWYWLTWINFVLNVVRLFHSLYRKFAIFPCHIKHLAVLSLSTCSYDITLSRFSKKLQWCTFQLSNATSVNFLCQCLTVLLLFFFFSIRHISSQLPVSISFDLHSRPLILFLPLSLSLSLSPSVSAVS